MEFYDEERQSVRLGPIYQEGHESQVVVLTSVSLGENFPLGRYPQPYFFVIIGRSEDSYTLRDAEGQEVTVPFETHLQWYLYDANEWVQWDLKRRKVADKKAQRRLDSVIQQRDLLRAILTDQGVRVVTEEQARQLGLE
jgi:hypothetical protein